jgi:hypothetical protein
MFRTKKGSLNRLNLRDLFRFLVVLLLFFPATEKLSADSGNPSLDESKEIYYQKRPDEPEEIILKKTKNTLIEIFASVYTIQDDRFKKIYEGQGYTYGFGLSRKIHDLNQHNFFLSLNLRFYSKKGKSTYSDDDTKLIITPVSLGGTYMFVTKRIIPFAEIGADYYSYKEESILHSTSGTAWGFHLEGGILIPFIVLKSIKAKLFFRYSQANTTENNLAVNLGGIEYGVGIIYEFNAF